MTDEEFHLESADDFARLAKALRRAGRSEWRSALTKGLRVGAKPLIPLIREAARDRLPKRGGLNELKASAPMRVQVRTTIRNAAVAIVMKDTQDGYLTGEIRHPVFERNKSARGRGGSEVPWVVQHVDGEWFDGTIDDNASKVLPVLDAAVGDVVEQILKEAGG